MKLTQKQISEKIQAFEKALLVELQPIVEELTGINLETKKKEGITKIRRAIINAFDEVVEVNKGLETTKKDLKPVFTTFSLAYHPDKFTNEAPAENPKDEQTINKANLLICLKKLNLVDEIQKQLANYNPREFTYDTFRQFLATVAQEEQREEAGTFGRAWEDMGQNRQEAAWAFGEELYTDLYNFFFMHTRYYEPFQTLVQIGLGLTCGWVVGTLVIASVAQYGIDIALNISKAVNDFFTNLLTYDAYAKEKSIYLKSNALQYAMLVKNYCANQRELDARFGGSSDEDILDNVLQEVKAGLSATYPDLSPEEITEQAQFILEKNICYPYSPSLYDDFTLITKAVFNQLAAPLPDNMLSLVIDLALVRPFKAVLGTAFICTSTLINLASIFNVVLFFANVIVSLAAICTAFALVNTPLYLYDLLIGKDCQDTSDTCYADKNAGPEPIPSRENPILAKSLSLLMWAKQTVPEPEMLIPAAILSM